jgi:hypothetical protein
LPDARGHAAGHIASAGAPFPMMAVFAIIVWAAPRLRRNPEVWVLGAVLAVALLAALAGNMRVVNAIHGDNWSDVQASALGSTRSGFASGHDLAGVGQLAAVAAVVFLTIALRTRRHLSTPIAIGAIAASIVFPPWIIPGAGLLVLAAALCVARSRRRSTATQ